MRASVAVLVLMTGAATAAQAQQLYRWTDEKGRVHITDTPPPASATNVQRRKPPAAPVGESQQSFELGQAVKDFPVTLYTSSDCKQGCTAARAALNRRGAPFKEIEVADEDTQAELKRVAGASEVPTLVVGRSVHRGFQQEAYDSLLDAARYPRTGRLPPRAQKPDPVKSEAEAPAATGPYAPRPPRFER